jgi:hypothetical protein
MTFGVSGGPEVGYRRVDALLIGCGHVLKTCSMLLVVAVLVMAGGVVIVAVSCRA